MWAVSQCLLVFILDGRPQLTFALFYYPVTEDQDVALPWDDAQPSVVAGQHPPHRVVGKATEGAGASEETLEYPSQWHAPEFRGLTFLHCAGRRLLSKMRSRDLRVQAANWFDGAVLESPTGRVHRYFICL